jgi:hypothetical protein
MKEIVSSTKFGRWGCVENVTKKLLLGARMVLFMPIEEFCGRVNQISANRPAGKHEWHNNKSTCVDGRGTVAWSNKSIAAQSRFTNDNEIQIFSVSLAIEMMSCDAVCFCDLLFSNGLMMRF